MAAAGKLALLKKLKLLIWENLLKNPLLSQNVHLAVKRE